MDHRLNEWIARRGSSNKDSAFAAGYRSLGGNAETLKEDVDQSYTKFQSRFPIDVYSNYLRASTQKLVRENVLGTYKELAPRQMYIYLKRCRLTELKKFLDDPGIPLGDELLDGAEDAVAKAAKVFRPDRLNHLLYCANQHDINRRTLYGFGVPLNSLVEPRHTWAVQKRIMITFDLAGIPAVEAYAAEVLRELHDHPGIIEEGHLLLTYEQSVERMARLEVRRAFRQLINGQLPAVDASSLEVVMFDTIFCAEIVPLS